MPSGSRHRLARLLRPLCLAVLVAVAAAASAAEPVGRISGLEGTADVLHAGAAGRTALAQGDAVLLGDQLRTAADGKLRITLRDESVLTLGVASELTLTEQLVAPAPVSRFQLLLGTMRALVPERYSQPSSRFEVETPTAVAGVRGTSFIAAYDPTDDETMVVGLEDVTRVRARADAEGAGEVLVGPGTATWVRRGRRPLAPAAVAKDRLRELRGATELGPGAGAVSGKAPNAGDARRPHRAGDGAFSREEQAVDQPLFGAGQPKPPPPPPPVPRRRR